MERLKSRTARSIPVLYRLERAGFVSVRWETPERGVPRKYYQLTDAGRAELEQLRQEWVTFANAMSALLGSVTSRPSREGSDEDR